MRFVLLNSSYKFIEYSVEIYSYSRDALPRNHHFLFSTREPKAYLSPFYKFLRLQYQQFAGLLRALPVYCQQSLYL